MKVLLSEHGTSRERHFQYTHDKLTNSLVHNVSLRACCSARDPAALWLLQTAASMHAT
jgi:hypothetical protein